MSRGGGKGSKFTTSNITHHMETWHPDLYGPLKAAADEKKAIEKASKGHNIQTFFEYSRSNPAGEAPSQSQGACGGSVGVASASNEVEGMIQATLEETLEVTWDINDKRAKIMTYKILEMMAMDNRPFSMVTDIGFARLINYVKPK